MAKTYNGHPSRNAWNVSLWINNDEGIYRRAVELCKRHTRSEAARILLSELGDKTPDGVPYTYTNVRRALAGIL